MSVMKQNCETRRVKFEKNESFLLISSIYVYRNMLTDISMLLNEFLVLVKYVTVIMAMKREIIFILFKFKFKLWTFRFSVRFSVNT